LQATTITGGGGGVRGIAAAKAAASAFRHSSLPVWFIASAFLGDEMNAYGAFVATVTIDGVAVTRKRRCA